MNRRNWLANSFCARVYEVWFYEAVASGRIKAPGFFRSACVRRAWLKADWIGPARGHIDEMKEIQAAEKRIALGITTHTQETIEQNGGEWKSNVKRLKIELALKGTSSLEPAPDGQEEDPKAPEAPEEKDDSGDDTNTDEPQESEDETT